MVDGLEIDDFQKRKAREVSPKAGGTEVSEEYC